MTLYSNNCPNCKVVKKVLTSKDISFREINDMNEIMRVAKREQLAVMPLLDIDGVFFSGTEAINKAKEM